MIFLFFGSSLAHLEPELELFEVWETMVGQIITIIANVIMWRLEQNVTITIVVQQWSHRSDHCQRLRSRKEISTSTADSPAVHFSVLSWWCSIPRTEPPPSAANNFTVLYFRALHCTLHSSLIQKPKPLPVKISIIPTARSAVPLATFSLLEWFYQRNGWVGLNRSLCGNLKSCNLFKGNYRGFKEMYCCITKCVFISLKCITNLQRKWITDDVGERTSSVRAAWQLRGRYPNNLWKKYCNLWVYNRHMYKIKSKFIKEGGKYYWRWVGRLLRNLTGTCTLHR